MGSCIKAPVFLVVVVVDTVTYSRLGKHRAGPYARA